MCVGYVCVKYVFLRAGEHFIYLFIFTFWSNKYVPSNILSARFLQAHEIGRRLYSKFMSKLQNSHYFLRKSKNFHKLYKFTVAWYTRYFPPLDLVFYTITLSVIFSLFIRVQ